MLSAGLSSVTVTDATGAAGATPTFTVTLLLFPSMVAVTIVEPELMAVTTPEEFTEATVGFCVDQLTTRPANVFPSASSAVALNVTDPPTTTDAVDGETCTEATTAETTDSGTVAVRPLLVAEIVVEPALIAVTSPVEEICAMVEFAEDQTMA
jgi:hypothetical protein